MIQQTFLQKCHLFLNQGQHNEILLSYYGVFVLDPRHF